MPAVSKFKLYKKKEYTKKGELINIDFMSPNNTHTDMNAEFVHNIYE